MFINKKFKGGFLLTVGYILSPLSWWNDFFINIPIAYLFGYLCGLISKNLFLPFMIIGYWLTNISGLMIMHKGILGIFSKTNRRYTKEKLLKDLLISIFYTLAIIILVIAGILKSPVEYFK